MKGLLSITFSAHLVMSCHKQSIRCRILHYLGQHLKRNHYFEFCDFRLSRGKKDKTEMHCRLFRIHRLRSTRKKDGKILLEVTRPRGGGGRCEWKVPRIVPRVTRWSHWDYSTAITVHYREALPLTMDYYWVLNVCFQM